MNKCKHCNQETRLEYRVIGKDKDLGWNIEHKFEIGHTKTCRDFMKDITKDRHINKGL